MSRRVIRVVEHLIPQGWVKRPRLQILVVVANIQIRTLKTEVEKGSMLTALEYGLIGPKRNCNYYKWKFSLENFILERELS